MFKKVALIFLPLVSIVLFIISFTYVVAIKRDQTNSNLNYRMSNLSYSDITTITQNERWNQTSSTNELLAKKKIDGNFTAKNDYLGIIAIPFYTHNKSINDKIIFRIKETGRKIWYYQNTYNAAQFQSNIPFPFGFPVIKNSKNISYTLEVESLSGRPGNVLSFSKTNHYFLAKYKFSRSDLVKNPNLFSQFFVAKVSSQLSLLSFGEILSILLFSVFFPLILYLGLRARTSAIIQLNKYEKLFWLFPVFVLLVYNLIFLNRFYPITEGWFSTYAWLFNHGQFPYRDFYFFLTPFYLIIMSIFTAIFGYDILYLRIFGLGVILLMTYFLHKNFEIIFGAPIAAFIATFGMIYYQSNNAHITYDFIQFLTLFGLIQSYFLLRYVNASGTEANLGRKWVFLAGLFAALAFLTKQSNGAMIIAFSFAGLLLLSISKGKKEVLRTSLSYIGGFAVPVIITILWLFANSAFSQFFEQVLSGAVAAKGGLVQIFFAWFMGLLSYVFIDRFMNIIFLVLVFGYLIYFFTGEKGKNGNINRGLMLVASSIMLPVVLLPLLISKGAVNELSKLGQIVINNIIDIIVAAVSTPLISILTAGIFFILKKPFNKSIFIFSFVSLGFIYGTGTSAGITQVGAFAGFCLFIALMLHYKSVLGLGKIFIVLTCISFTFILVELKYEVPYFWWNMTSPDVRVKLQTTNEIKMLRGMYTSADNMRLIKEVTAEISSGSKPGESVLLFPNIPVFYLFADRKPPGKAVVHWFDFLPDGMAVKEAELIRKNPPKVIVYLDLGPSVWEAHERLFRNGKPSGQRRVNEAIMEVIKSEKMHISKRYVLTNDSKRYASTSKVLLTIWRK
ncbi:glycosyltransferase family 39 protein [Patescibacteria group bacterium]|nr:glycosyltransferase family 39 protein [Patescibacteria group bacterium]MBU4016078.1 glycosyltransferase family 39 protein [Patescibacteria group bacterium]MBU4098093.1 glycosyltransferase family 39 protein [Patescibacteria group bacterium]